MSASAAAAARHRFPHSRSPPPAARCPSPGRGFLASCRLSPRGRVRPSGAGAASRRPSAPGTTAFSYPAAPAGTYYGRIVSLSACGTRDRLGRFTDFTVAPTPGGRPAPRIHLRPTPAAARHVERGLCGGKRIGATCGPPAVTSGGNNVWLYRLVQALRQLRHALGAQLEARQRRRHVAGRRSPTTSAPIPTRARPTSTSSTSSPDTAAATRTAAWIDNTEATRQAGTIGRWTLQPYLAARRHP